MTHPHVDPEVLDPWDEAEKAKPLVYTHFGQIMAHSDYVIWPKGVRLADCPPFDPKQHTEGNRVTRVTIMASPLPGQQQPTWPHERVMGIYTPEWTKVTLPSIKALNVSPRDLDKVFAQYQFKEARKYTNKEGEVKSATSFHFVELYETEAACVAAAEAMFGKSNGAAADDEPLPWDDGDEAKAKEPVGDNGAGTVTKQTRQPDGTMGEPVTLVNDQAKAALVPFLGPLVQACASKEEVAVKIADNPMLAEHFDITSPEVIKAMEAASLPPF